MGNSPSFLFPVPAFTAASCRSSLALQEKMVSVHGGFVCILLVEDGGLQAGAFWSRYSVVVFSSIGYIAGECVCVCLCASERTSEPLVLSIFFLGFCVRVVGLELLVFGQKVQ